MNGPAQDIHWTVIIVKPSARFIAGRGMIKGVTTLAAINLCVLAKLFDHLLSGSVPALEMPNAEFALRILLVASPLAWFFLLEF
jgi:hypothetical protein